MSYQINPFNPSRGKMSKNETKETLFLFVLCFYDASSISAAFSFILSFDFDPKTDEVTDESMSELVWSDQSTDACAIII